MPTPTTFTYKTVLGVDYQLDVWLPEEDSLARAGWRAAPVLCYYHGEFFCAADDFPASHTEPGHAGAGGGLCAGTRDWNAWVPDWLFCTLFLAIKMTLKEG